ncbi:MAG TPA: hypothetical protein VJ724_04610 [Tahibacter sp.]|nr:hypothetical protein [Tahibacter sp.]
MKTAMLGAAVGAMMFCVAAGAAPKAEPVVNANNRTALAETAAAVREQFKTGGRFEFVKADERSTIERRFGEMGAILEHGDVASLSKPQIADLYVAQEDINAILTKRDGRRVICERVKTIGSHMKSQQCVTYAEPERVRRNTQDYMRNNMKAARCVAQPDETCQQHMRPVQGRPGAGL